MDGRPLTAAETALVRSVFGNSIDYSRVRLFKRKWWPFQPRNTAMAPMGNIYFHPEGGVWSDDFAKETLRRQDGNRCCPSAPWRNCGVGTATICA